jgi:hypothetical protein
LARTLYSAFHILCEQKKKNNLSWYIAFGQVRLVERDPLTHFSTGDGMTLPYSFWHHGVSFLRELLPAYSKQSTKSVSKENKKVQYRYGQLNIYHRASLVALDTEQKNTLSVSVCR